jgi:hypothetical protein
VARREPSARKRAFSEEESLQRGREPSARKRAFSEEESLQRRREPSAPKRAFSEEESLQRRKRKTDEANVQTGIRIGLILTLAIAQAGAATADGGATEASWMPLEPGRSWTYIYERDSVRRTGGAAPEHERFRGTLHDRVEGPAPEFGTDAVEVISTLRGRIAGSPIERTETRRAYLESAGLGYRIHALDAENQILGSNQLARYDPPLAQLTVGPGAEPRWSVGAVDLGGLKTKLEAEIVGFQDADTPAGRYADCLVVHYEGELRGSFEVYGGRADVTGGSIAVTEWFARGVGLVLAKEDVEQHLTMPDGSTTTISEHIQYMLSALGGPSEPNPASR